MRILTWQVFFYKLIIREVAGVQSWEATAQVKPMLQESARRFDLHIRKMIGMAQSLMMPGNYARQMFGADNVNIVLELIPNATKRHHLLAIFEKLRFIRKLYRSNNPHKEFPDDISILKQTAVEMGNLLKAHFSYATWPNDRHKVIEHSQELIESEDGPMSIGGMSSEGNEAGNHVFMQSHTW